jgi:16S rRNA (cytosine967-C5)-methyltransferase
LLDAPCSATGIIRRHPDIKLLRRDSDIVKLAATQLKLLAKAWSLLKQNGELVYSTCSILPTENEQVIDTFSRQCESVCVLPIQAGWGENTSMGRQLLPGINSTDGFFFARLKKQSR